jgi:hypothetical protein
VTPSTLRIAFDESGNTGEDLLNVHQPIYALASVGVAPEIAVNLIPGWREKEFHFQQARKSPGGRHRILTVLTAPTMTAESVRISVVHKHFMVTAKMVDTLIEPVALAIGIDFYQDGMHLALANMLHLTMPVLAPDEWSDTQRRFVAMFRERTEEKIDAFYSSLDALEGALGRGEEDWLVNSLRMSRQVLTMHTPTELDPAFTCFMSLVQDWAASVGRFSVLHDESKEMLRWQRLFDCLKDESAPTLRVQTYQGGQIQYPVPVTDLQFLPSTADPGIQLADLVAGACRFVCTSKVGSCPDEAFARSLEETPVLEWAIGASLWPTDAITPEELGVQPGATPWQADAMARWLHSRESDDEGAP